MGAYVPLLRCTSSTAVRVSAASVLAPFTVVRAGVTRIPYGQAGRVFYVAGLVDGTFLAAGLLLYSYYRLA